MAGMAFMGWVLVIGGTISLIIFNRSDTQNLFCNSFWGNGDKYPFWNEDKRPSFNRQLDIARKMNSKTQKAFKIESQEFLNLFFMPELTITRKQKYNKFSSIYTFKLPAFQRGTSDLQYAFYQLQPQKPVNTWLSGNAAPSELIQKHVKSLKEEQEHYEKLKSQAEKIDGKLYVYDKELTARFRESLKTAELFWHYIPFEDAAVPLRYLAHKTEKSDISKKPILGFKGTEFR